MNGLFLILIDQISSKVEVVTLNAKPHIENSYSRRTQDGEFLVCTSVHVGIYIVAEKSQFKANKNISIQTEAR